ncbi:MAG: EI24 domain-containing protein [Pseudomonadota bacterium]
MNDAGIGRVLRLALLVIVQISERSLLGPVLIGVAVSGVLLILISAMFFGAAFFWSLILRQLGYDWGILDFMEVVWSLLIPTASLAIAFVVNPVAEAVERKHYPDLPPARPRKLLADIQHAATYTAIFAIINLNMIALYWLLPLAPAIVNGYLLGREYYVFAASRRHPPRQVAELRRSASREIWIAGIVLAVLGMVPFLSLFAPVIGMALMTHLVHSRSEPSGCPPTERFKLPLTMRKPI